MIFNNLKEFEAYINKLLAETMNDEVAKKVKEVEQRNVEDEVYQGYVTNNTGGQPWRYKRRRTKEGLQDTSNMVHNVDVMRNSVQLTVENITTGSNDDFRLDTLIEYGDGYDGKEYQYKDNRDDTADQYLKPRPFTQGTIDELKMNKEHVTALKNGLKARGVDVVRK